MSHFWDGFEKAASARWTREILKLSPHSRKLLSGLTGKVRQIKHLGAGADQVADLVHHPEHGLSVRKIPLARYDHPLVIEQSASRKNKIDDMMGRLKDVSHGHEEFAHQLSRKGNVSYQEYSPPGARDWGPRLVKGLNKNKKIEDSLRRESRRSNNKEDFRGKLNRAAKRVSKYKEMLHQETKLSPKGEAVLSELKKDYPGLHDVRKSNIVGGKVVDMSPERGMITAYLNHAVKDPLGFSRKTFLGKKD